MIFAGLLIISDVLAGSINTNFGKFLGLQIGGDRLGVLFTDRLICDSRNERCHRDLRLRCREDGSGGSGLLPYHTLLDYPLE